MAGVKSLYFSLIFLIYKTRFPKPSQLPVGRAQASGSRQTQVWTLAPLERSPKEPLWASVSRSLNRGWLSQLQRGTVRTKWGNIYIVLTYRRDSINVFSLFPLTPINIMELNQKNHKSIYAINSAPTCSSLIYPVTFIHLSIWLSIHPPIHLFTYVHILFTQKLIELLQSAVFQRWKAKVPCSQVLIIWVQYMLLSVTSLSDVQSFAQPRLIY